jgi:tRNA(Arg) A34 adenosine deaminase TadA
MDDTALTREARLEAQAAYDRGERAVGAVLIQNGQKVARAGKRDADMHDPTDTC